MITRRLMYILFIACFIIILPKCATVPITGRTQLNIISDEQLIYLSNQSFSSFMAYARDKKAVLSSTESPKAAITIDTVRRVSKRIIEAANVQGRLDWQVEVIKSRNMNAFVMPNGKIIIFTGLLPVVKTEAGLATIIGHEVAHVVARHQAERMSQVLLAQIGLNVADILLTASNSKYQPAISAGLGLGAQYGVLLPFSRKHESEADHIGMFYMAKAGYDPSEAIAAWKRIESTGKSGPWELLSTHPSHASRLDNFHKWLPEANLYYLDKARALPASLSEVQAAVSEQSSRIALAPVAQRPVIDIGYWYRYKNQNSAKSVIARVEQKIRCSTGECFVVSLGGEKESAVRSAEFNPVEYRNASGSWKRFTPALPYVRFPLSVGDSWTESILIEYSSGRKEKAIFKANVVSYESVNVPNRSFMAYKVVITLGGVNFGEIWYAPEARTYVRNVAYDKNGNQNISELIDFQLSAEPSGPMMTD